MDRCHATSPNPFFLSSEWKWKKKGGGDTSFHPLLSASFIRGQQAREQSWTLRRSIKMVISNQISGRRHQGLRRGAGGRNAAERGLQGSEHFQRIYQRVTECSIGSDNR